jgi:hypothetical protein
MFRHIPTLLSLLVLVGSYWIVSYMEYLEYIKYGII